MDVLARIFSGGLMAATPSVDSNFWYGPAGGTLSAAGMKITAESAQTVSAWFRGRDILATTLAMLPFGMYTRLPNDEGRAAAPTHRLHDVLHRKPNPWQDSFLWRRQAMYKLIDHGNSYHAIKPSPARGFVGELWPIEPRCVTPELLASGRKVFHIRDPKTGMTRTFIQDDIFHLCGPSDDGVEGKGILAKARDSIGLSMALEGYAATIFDRGAMHGGVIKVPGVLNEEASKRMAQSVTAATAGPANWHMPFVLEQGAEWTLNSMTPEDAQMLLSRKFSVNDIARWLGLPPHMLGDLEKSSFTNIEHMGLEFVTYAEGPWLSLWEFATNDQLLLPDEVATDYAEFNRDALVRGDIATRWAAYVSSTNAGIRTRNEVRIKENLRALPGLDTPLDPQNITGKPPATGSAPPATRPPSDDPSEARARAIVTESSARVLRKELIASERASVKFAADPEGWAAWVEAFYADHHVLVMQTMLLDEANARRYVALQRSELLTGVSVTAAWTPDFLAELALDLPTLDPMPALLRAAIDKPMPPVSVQTTIEKGAVAVQSAPVTVAASPVTVTTAPTTVTIEQGAVQHETHIATSSKKAVVKKTVTRDAKGQITGVTEESREG